MKTETKDELRKELSELLNDHDWYYRYSESHSDWTKGRNEGQYMDILVERAYDISEEFGDEARQMIRDSNPHLK